MLFVLSDRTYRHLFGAQVVALLGTGLLTVALGLLAYRLAGAEAGLVLGTALAIKMIAYVVVAPVAGAFAARLPRRAFMIATDLVRAAVALCLPFVTQIWEIYLLVFVLQAASAAFTPTFQATTPDILPDEKDYTRALSLSRLAYDLENLASPALAAALLTLLEFHWLFAGTFVGFLGSAALVASVGLPATAPDARAGGLLDRTTRGLRTYVATPRLRGLLALNLALAAAGAMVIVNTVVIVRGVLARPETEVALALGAFGAGSMLAALLLPRALDHVTDRNLMLTAATMLGGLLVALAAVASWWSPGGPWAWATLLTVWGLLGIGYSAAQTPTGRLVRRSAHPADRNAAFAAQFALSHAAWLVTYPLAGWLGVRFGMPATLSILGAIALTAVALARRLWPAEDGAIAHDHPELRADHPHLRGHGTPHRHDVVIDDLHPAWPLVRV